MTKNDVLTGYMEAFNNEGTHIRDDESGIDVYVKVRDTMTVVTIWGSTEEKDWVTNFKFMFKKKKRSPLARKDSKIRVHAGYMKGWMRIREKVLALVNTDIVFVNGFSMGGGLSSIVAVDIQYNKNTKNLLCLDLDGPKVWNKAGRDSFNKRVPDSVKLTYGNDIVPKLVPWYYSGGEHIHLGEKRKWYKMSINDHLMVSLHPEVIKLLIEEYYKERV